MSLSTQTQVRLPKIKLGLLKHSTHKEIGIQCHVTEKTIDRDIQTWVRTPDFEQWIKELWLDKYAKVDDIEAFRAVTKLFAKMMTQKIEREDKIIEERKISIDITATLREYQAILSKIVDNTVQPNRTAKPLDTPQTHP